MPIVNDLVDDLVDEHEILPNALFVQHAAIVPKNLHHSIDDVKDGRWRHIRLTRSHKVNAKLLSEEVVDPINMLYIHIYKEEESN